MPLIVVYYFNMKKKTFLLLSLGAIGLISCSNISSSSNQNSTSDQNYSSDQTSSNPDSSTSSASLSSSESSSSFSSSLSSKEAVTKFSSVTFGDNKNANGSEISSGKVSSLGTINGDDIFLEYSSSKCYFKSGSALRVGSKDSGGSFVIKLNDTYHINSIKIYAFAWSESEIDTVLKLQVSTFSDSSRVVSNYNYDETSPYSYSPNLESSSFSISSLKGSKARILIGKIEISYTAYENKESSYNSSSNSNSSSGSYSPPSFSADLAQYYSSVDWTLLGANLKTSLKEVISANTKSIAYNNLNPYYPTTDGNENGKIIDIYSSKLWDVSETGNYSKEGDAWNKEHIIPQSIFGRASPMVSDLHHLYPTDGKVNCVRNNYPHGYVSIASYESSNHTKIGGGDYNRNHAQSGTFCEVPDEYKGDIARTYFYFVTRYQNELVSWGDYAPLNNTTFPSLKKWAINVYLEWNDMDPVSEKEIKRNNAIYKIQNNRNPFIDYSDAAHLIWDNYR